MQKIKGSVAIVANGEIADYSLIFEKLKNYDIVIAADGGASHCLKLNIVPSMIIGDLDSISQEALTAFAAVPTLKFPKEKDETDLELAIFKAFSLNSEKVALFAATGNRIDHTLANLHLLRRFPSKLFIYTEKETIFAINETVAREPYKIGAAIDQTVSFLPIGGDVTSVTTKGFKWELKETNLSQNFYSISNVCIAKNSSISLKNGDLLVFLG